MLKVIVAGTRGFTDYSLLRERLDFFFSKVQEPIEIVSGTARGADRLGERYAKERGFPVSRFPADWEGKGRIAGYERNRQMAKYATHLVAFWDKRSRGTKMMIELALERSLNVRVVIIDAKTSKSK